MKPVFRRMSPGGRRGRLSVLIFHRVLETPDPLFPDLPDTVQFDRILSWLTSWFNVLPLDQALGLLASGALPERAAAVTFDDGYADNHDVALPLLRHHGISATFFIATGFIDGGRMWNDTVIAAVRACRTPAVDLQGLGLGSHRVATDEERRRAIDAIIAQLKYRPLEEREALTVQIGELAGAASDRPMMTAAQILALRRAGMQIGAHTVTHPILARLPDDEARAEIRDSRNALESILDERVGLFAYPNGRPGADYLPVHAAMVREAGFDAALTTEPGAASMATDRMELPRFTPWERDRLRFGVRLATNLRRA